MFAHGGICKIYADIGQCSKVVHEKIFPLGYEHIKLGFLKENASKYGYSVYIYGKDIYKITLLFSIKDNVYIKSVAYKLGLLDNSNFNIIIESGCLQIISAFAGKKEGIVYICDKIYIMRLIYSEKDV